MRLILLGLCYTWAMSKNYQENNMQLTEADQRIAGNVRSVACVGDTVRRSVGPWSKASHAVLKHLERVGFDGAPRFLGIDAQGREVLSYLSICVLFGPQ